MDEINLKIVDELLYNENDILYRTKYDNFQQEFTLEKFSFLDGLTSVGLVLIAIENKDYTIGNVLNLY